MDDIAIKSWLAAPTEAAAAESFPVKARWPLVMVLIVTAAVYVGTSAWPVILDETDGQYAGAAREMLQRGDWLVPTNNGLPRLQKPPLVYWLTRLSLQTFGVNEFAARLPNALATLAWIFATYLIGKRLGGQQRGLFGATIFASMLGLFLFSHRIMPEPFLAAFVSLAVWCFVSALRDREKASRWFFWAWIFMGFAVLSKGLHGALYPLAIAGIAALVLPQTRPVWRGLLSLPGIAAFLAITVPWYAAMAIRFPGFLAYHFFNEQAGHAFNTNVPRDCEPVPFGIFWGQHLFFLFPWILFAPALIWIWRTAARQHRSAAKTFGVHPSGCSASATDRANLEPILWIWILITAISISFSVRQDHYSMPAWGAVALCLALPWLTERPAIRKWLIAPCVTIAIVGAVVAVCGTFLSHPVMAAANEVKPEAARGDIHSAMRGLSIAVWRDCSPLAIVAGLAWLAGGGLAAALVVRGRQMAAGFVIAGAMALVFPMVTLGYARVQDYFSLVDAAKVINQTAKPNALVVCEGEPHLSASLFFYLNRQVCWAGAQTGSVLGAEAHHIAVGPFIDDHELARNWHSPRQVFFIVEKSRLPEWQQKLSITKEQPLQVAQDGTRVVVVNEPARSTSFVHAGGSLSGRRWLELSRQF